MAKNKQILYNVDTEIVDGVIKDTEDNSAYFNEIALKNAEIHTKELDKIMLAGLKHIQNDDCEVSVLEKYLLMLTNTVYFMYEKLEKLSIYEDLAVANAKEKYNDEYLEYQVKDVIDKKNKTTVAETTAHAEKSTMYESVMANIYGHTYTLVKNKIDSALRMVDSLKKIISHRMQEESLSSGISNKQTTSSARFDPDAFQ